MRLRNWRDNFWFQGRRPKIYFNREHGHQIHPDYSVVGWDDHEQWVERIRNYRDKPIDVEIRMNFNGHVIFTSDLAPKLHDYRSPQFAARIKAGKKKDLGYDVTYKQGINRKQNNVTLDNG